ncbi:MAG: hypothetical protein ACE5GM_03245 [bacterium]
MKITERRNTQRFSCQVYAHIWVQNWIARGDTIKIAANVLDISRSGAKVEIKEENSLYTDILWDQMVSQQTVCLALKLNHAKEPSVITGSMTWLSSKDTSIDQPNSDADKDMENDSHLQAGFHFDPIDSIGIGEINSFINKSFYN